MISTDPGIRLSFSSDTVLFDTVFSSIGSITKRLMVFNNNDNAVNIERIEVAGGSNSPYTLTVRGLDGKDFNDQLLLGKDSLLILVEVTIDPGDQNLPFLVRDSIEFLTNGNQQDVTLVAWGQDANFLNDSILTCDITWTADRPYVITNSILIDSLCQLTIEKGAQIFSGPGSFIFVGGTLIVEGDSAERVWFRNDRLEEPFENAPGQWGGIIFLEGTKDNRIDYAVIRNAEVGVRLGAPDNDTIPDLVLSNTIIENILSTGILAFTSDLYAYNVLVNNCGEFVVGNFAGGNYIYEHCTFANFPFQFFRENPVAAFTDNVILADNTVLSEDISVELFNSIIWGSEEEELLLNNDGGSNVFFTAGFNIIKTGINELDINNNILNQDPRFVEPELYDYRIDSLSPGIDRGADLMIPIDLDGNPRDSLPDIGAYENKP